VRSSRRDSTPRLGGLAAAALSAVLVACSGEGRPGDASAAGPQGVVLVVLDTLRADHLSCYGYERPTSPHIDGLARDGVLFRNASSNAPWTLPAALALLSGEYPERFESDVLPRSLVESLAAAGVVTAAFTEGGYFSRRFGLDRGFDEYVEEEGAVRYDTEHGGAGGPKARGADDASPDDARSGETPGGASAHDAHGPSRAEPGGIARTFASAREWLADVGDEPFFLLIHTYEVHTPYTRLELTGGLSTGALGRRLTIEQLPRLKSGEIPVGAAEIAYARALYDGGVATADRHVGELLALLDDRGLADRTAIVVTSDHGEELGDHYPRHLGDHGHSLRDPLLRVPLVLFDPTRRPVVGEVDAQVRLLDVMPTVADLLDVPLAGPRDGASLLPLVTGAETADRVALAGQTWRGPRRGSVRALGYKYIRSAGSADGEVPLVPEPPTRQLYDLRADPGETVNLADTRPRLVESLDQMLRTTLGDVLRQVEPDVPEGVDPELLDRLRSLGYVR